MATYKLSNDSTKSYIDFEKNVLTYFFDPFKAQIVSHLDEQKKNGPEGTPQEKIINALDAWLNVVRITPGLDSKVLGNILTGALISDAPDALTLAQAALREMPEAREVRKDRAQKTSDMRAIDISNKDTVAKVEVENRGPSPSPSPTGSAPRF